MPFPASPHSLAVLESPSLPALHTRAKGSTQAFSVSLQTYSGFWLPTGSVNRHRTGCSTPGFPPGLPRKIWALRLLTVSQGVIQLLCLVDGKKVNNPIWSSSWAIWKKQKVIDKCIEELICVCPYNLMTCPRARNPRSLLCQDGIDHPILRTLDEDDDDNRRTPPFKSSSHGLAHLAKKRCRKPSDHQVFIWINSTTVTNHAQHYCCEFSKHSIAL